MDIIDYRVKFQCATAQLIRPGKTDSKHKNSKTKHQTGKPEKGQFMVAQLKTTLQFAQYS